MRATKKRGPGRPPLGKRALTPAEKQARFRERRESKMQHYQSLTIHLLGMVTPMADELAKRGAHVDDNPHIKTIVDKLEGLLDTIEEEISPNWRRKTEAALQSIKTYYPKD